MQDKIDADLKTAMLDGDRTKVETLRGLKNALQNEAINSGDKDKPLSDDQIEKVLAREAKKRAEAAEIYKKGGSDERAHAEMDEKRIIDSYLPEQASEGDIQKAVDEELAKIDSPTMANMGQIMGAVRARLGSSADGAAVASAVKGRLEKQ